MTRAGKNHDQIAKESKFGTIDDLYDILDQVQLRIIKSWKD